MTEVYNGTTNLQYLSFANLYGWMVSHISLWHSRYLEFQTRSTSLLQYRGRDRLYSGSERECLVPRFHKPGEYFHVIERRGK